MREKVTVPAIQARKQGPKLTMVTAYDAPMARIVDQAEIDLLLVGDSVGTTVLGYEDTLAVTLEDMLHHTKAVTRVRPQSLVVTDLPWLGYHISPEETVRNAGRLVKEGRADAVKLEGGRKRLPMIKALLDAEIPVMGHLGLTPQSINMMGGHRVQGKDLTAAREMIADAHALTKAGIFALVLEGIPDTLACLITQEIAIPTIGIGAGIHCDGQVLVLHDLLGLTSGHLPKFVRQFANLTESATTALQAYRAAVQDSTFPNDKESYHLGKDVLQTLLQDHEPQLDE